MYNEKNMIVSEHGEKLKDPGKMQELLVQRLECTRAEFVEQMKYIQDKRSQGKKWSASGVLVPLELDPELREFVFVLNKRSAQVQQPGDLCCPGGSTDDRIDNSLARLLAWRLFPSTRSESFLRLLKAEKQEKEALLFVLAGVLRESWEEMRLKPWNVEYLGALPTHALPNFSQVIFPVVGRIKHSWKPRPNWEVEKVIRLPLREFFQPENYALCKVSLPPLARKKFGVESWEVPCLVVRDDGSDEILWGATFRILLTFMTQVFDLSVEQIHPVRKIQKKMPANYYAGRKQRRKEAGH